MKGGIVAYSRSVKGFLAASPGADRGARRGLGGGGRELADGARSRLDADVGVGVTGIAGPGGGTPEKPVGLVWLSVALPDGLDLTRSVNLPGGRADVRDRATTVAMPI